MRKKIKKKYQPNNYSQDGFLKFYSFKYKELSIKEYMPEFYLLMMKHNLVELEDQTINPYEEGKLAMPIKEDLSLFKRLKCCSMRERR